MSKLVTCKAFQNRNYDGTNKRFTCRYKGMEIPSCHHAFSRLTAMSSPFQPPTKDTRYGPILDPKVPSTQNMQIKPIAHQQENWQSYSCISPYLSPLSSLEQVGITSPGYP